MDRNTIIPRWTTLAEAKKLYSFTEHAVGSSNKLHTVISAVTAALIADLNLNPSRVPFSRDYWI